MTSIQGRRLEARSFPSFHHAVGVNKTVFESRSRILIDLKRVLIVQTEGSEEAENDPSLAYQRTLYRLELQAPHRENLRFADDSKLNIDQCEKLLRQEFAKFPYYQILAVKFPFFEESAIRSGRAKGRPCVAFFGDGDGPALFISMYMGGINDVQRSKTTMNLAVPGDVSSTFAEPSFVDVSKLCGIPEEYHRPGDAVADGNETWRDYEIKDKGQKHNKKKGYLQATSPNELREKIITKLVVLLRESPLEYTDVTQELDIGSMVEQLLFVEGEGWVTELVPYSVPFVYDLSEDEQAGGTVAAAPLRLSDIESDSRVLQGATGKATAGMGGMSNKKTTEEMNNASGVADASMGREFK